MPSLVSFGLPVWEVAGLMGPPVDLGFPGNCVQALYPGSVKDSRSSTSPLAWFSLTIQNLFYWRT